MARKALTDEKYEIIKAHILDPENSPLPDNMKEQLDRVISMAKVLDRNPTIKHAVEIHKSKFSGLSDTTAYRDARLARKIYNSMHEFDFDFWQSWLINDIISNINRCRDSGTPMDKRVIAMEHANLIKAIGKRPDELPDPKRNEKHNFYLLVQINGENIKLDLNNIDKLPTAAVQEVNRALAGGKEIDEEGAMQIIQT